jgi:hypothetical protein
MDPEGLYSTRKRVNGTKGTSTLFPSFGCTMIFEVCHRSKHMPCAAHPTGWTLESGRLGFYGRVSRTTEDVKVDAGRSA